MRDSKKCEPPRDRHEAFEGLNITLNVIRDGACLYVETEVGADDATVLESDDEAKWPVGAVLTLGRDEQAEAAMEAEERYLDRADAAREDAADAARERAWEMGR